MCHEGLLLQHVAIPCKNALQHLSLLKGQFMADGWTSGYNSCRIARWMSFSLEAGPHACASHVKMGCYDDLHGML